MSRGAYYTQPRRALKAALTRKNRELPIKPMTKVAARRRAAVALACALLSLSACSGGSQDEAAPKAKLRAGAVVADISPGTNPYHEAFRRPGWTKHPCKVIPAIPCDLTELDLTLGDDYAANLAADAGVWASYEPGKVYWVPGTNLLLLTLRSVAPVLCPAACNMHDGYGGTDAYHGIATSGAMAMACQDCYVLVIQDAPTADGAAVEHVATELPWVDFVASTTLSGTGNPGGVIDGTLWDWNLLMPSYQQSTRDLSASGRMFFAATGNFAAGGMMPDPIQGYDYPPWVVAVGGMAAGNPFPDAVEKTCNAIDVLSGVPAEMLGEFSQNLPLGESIDGYDIKSGTSYSAPQLAARFGQALANVRSELGDTRAPGALWAGKATGSGALADGELTAEEMRNAFAATARYVAPTDFNPGCIAELAQRDPVLSVVTPKRPVTATPWVEMGWGYVGAEEAVGAADVILGRSSAGQKPAAAVTFMDGFMAARAAVFPSPKL